MKLSHLLAQHNESAHPAALKSNLGDSYLLQHNRVFRKVRLKTLALGYSYTDQVSSDYAAFPMSQLEVILETKKIPYLNNVNPLENINKRSCSTLDWDHVVDNIKPNYVFHESCHAIARSLSFKSAELQSQVTAMLIEESFANNCEFLAIADAQENLHRLFLEMNSYFVIFEDRTHLKKALDQYGQAQVFKLMLLTYLHANFLNEDIRDNEFKKLVELSNFANISSSETKYLKSLAENAFALNPRFRYSTTEMYLRLNGAQNGVAETLNFDYLQLILQNKNLIKLINELTEFIGADQ